MKEAIVSNLRFLPGFAQAFFDFFVRFSFAMKRVYLAPLKNTLK
jgi:hypothetical protein